MSYDLSTRSFLFAVCGLYWNGQILDEKTCNYRVKTPEMALVASLKGTKKKIKKRKRKKKREASTMAMMDDNEGLQIISNLKSLSTLPIHILKKDYDCCQQGRLSTLTTDEQYKIGAIQVEHYLDPLQGKKIPFRRIFLAISDRKDPYCVRVGWLVSNDVDHCLICSRPFSLFLTKHHCVACGNVACQSCSPRNAPIAELPDAGPQRICKFCDYGQV